MLELLLHEAAHVLAHVRGLREVSRQGRYHNQRYARLAREFGLQVEQDPRSGFGRTRLPTHARRRDAEVLARLQEALRAYPTLAEANDPLPQAVTGSEAPQPSARARALPSSGGGMRLLHCGCTPPRKLRVSRATFALGPIACGVCGLSFQEADGVEAALLQASGTHRPEGGSGSEEAQRPPGDPQSAGRGPPAPSPTPALDLPAFARAVNEEARTCPTGRFGPEKVFIHHVWARLQGRPGIGDLPSFQQRLLLANRAQLLSLCRADLVQAMNPDDVQRSETREANAIYHFIRCEEA